jgi:hypothetical protein
VATDDQGATWSAWGSAGVTFLAGDPGGHGFGALAASGEAQVWWSRDAGRTWAASAGLPREPLTVFAAPADARSAIALSPSAVWRTSDGGVSWWRSGSAPDGLAASRPRAVSATLVRWTSAGEPIVVRWAPADAAAGDVVPIVSRDAGASWQRLSPCTGCRAIVAPAAGGDALFAVGQTPIHSAYRRWDASGALVVRADRLGPDGWQGSGPTPRGVVEPADADEDGLTDAWQAHFGPGLGAADSDPDGDGRTTREEMVARTHPAATWTAGFAEGFGSLFATRVAVANPSRTQAARAWLREEAEGQLVRAMPMLIGPGETRTLADALRPAARPGALVIESDVPLSVTRTSQAIGTFLRGVHAATAVPPRATWYFAEGSTRAGFDLFYLLHNPSVHDTEVRLVFLPSQAPVTERRVALPAHSRASIWVNAEVPGLADDVAAIVETTDGTPVLAERSLYRSTPTTGLTDGVSSAGAGALATQWLFAEGVTGRSFQTYLLLANPSDRAAATQVEFLLPDGTTRQHALEVPARRRVTVDIAALGGALTATSFATLVTASVPVVVERTTWWEVFGRGPWWAGSAGGHASSGAPEPASAWVLPGVPGSGASSAADTRWGAYLTVAKLSEPPVRVVLRLRGDAGVMVAREVDLPAGRRRATFALADLDTAGRLSDQWITVEVEAEDSSAALVLEQSAYSQWPWVWGAGASTTATPR